MIHWTHPLTWPRRSSKWNVAYLHTQKRSQRHTAPSAIEKNRVQYCRTFPGNAIAWRRCSPTFLRSHAHVLRTQMSMMQSLCIFGLNHLSKNCKILSRVQCCKRPYYVRFLNIFYSQISVIFIIFHCNVTLYCSRCTFQAISCNIIKTFAFIIPRNTSLQYSCSFHTWGRYTALCFITWINASGWELRRKLDKKFHKI